jgi:mannose-6-phosphate isomerase
MRPDPALRCALRLAPTYRDYVWGGERLRPGHRPTAEAWVIYAENLIENGPLAGERLGQAAARFGPDLLGMAAYRQTGARFPLLIKLLDCAAWLSLQVHPNDAQAVELAGPGFFGKTEAWHFIEAGAEAQILCGVRSGVSRESLAAAIQNGSVLDLIEKVSVETGDTILLTPGMMHALGPGLLVYEVQQTSDLTYRVYDWGRPASAARKLHIAESLAVADPEKTAQVVRLPSLEAAPVQGLTRSDYFVLEMIGGAPGRLELDTRGESFHALTLLSGQASLQGDGWEARLAPLESLVIPAAAGGYALSAQTPIRMLKAQVPT